jgi:hypothetical protein
MRHQSKIALISRTMSLSMSLLVVTLASGQANPLSARVEITPGQTYSGQPLPKPTRILVYDFTVNPEDVQVDKTQQVRLRHIVMGDENQKKVGENAVEELAKELVKRLKKTGIPVERAKAGTTAPANTLSVEGNFLSVKQGEKTERVAIGMGAGSAEVKTKVNAQYTTPAKPVALSDFQTSTTLSENLGAAEPAAMGVNPAAAAAKATVGDRKKNVAAYAQKTADAIAKQLSDQMTSMGWITAEGKK